MQPDRQVKFLLVVVSALLMIIVMQMGVKNIPPAFAQGSRRQTLSRAASSPAKTYQYEVWTGDPDSLQAKINERAKSGWRVAECAGGAYGGINLGFYEKWMVILEK